MLSSGELGGQAAARASACSLPGGRVGFAVPRNFGSRGLTRSDLRPLEKDGKPNKTHGQPALEAEWLEGGKGHGYERHVRDRAADSDGRSCEWSGGGNLVTCGGACH